MIELLDSLIQTQSRTQSANRKNRPESSSPDKLKLRNQAKSNVSKGDNDEDEYSDEEIADDPDDGEDSQTNKTHNN